MHNIPNQWLPRLMSLDLILIFGIFSGEPIKVKSYITLNTIFEVRENAREIKVRYLVIARPSSYNMIIGKPTYNHLVVVLSTLCMCMKYQLLDGRVSVI